MKKQMLAPGNTHQPQIHSHLPLVTFGHNEGGSEME